MTLIQLDNSGLAQKPDRSRCRPSCPMKLLQVKSVVPPDVRRAARVGGPVARASSLSSFGLISFELWLDQTGRSVCPLSFGLWCKPHGFGLLVGLQVGEISLQVRSSARQLSLGLGDQSHS